MELPQINSLRKKDIQINGKTVTLKPWTNIQLVNYDETVTPETKLEKIEDILLKDNYESKLPLTYTEKRFVLIQLYILSKSSLLDIKFNCVHCKQESKITINIDNVAKWKDLATRIIKIEDYTFNLRPNSCYLIDLDNPNLNEETLKYLLSFIDNINISGTDYEISDMTALYKWFDEELPTNIFNSFIIEMNNIKPDISFSSDGICEHCGKSSLIEIRIEDFLE